MAPTLSSLKSEYDLLFESCLVRPARAAAVDSLTAKIRAKPADGSHVCVVASADADAWLVSHGSGAGPSKLRFSVEDGWQRAHGHGATTFLSVF
jgi:hypothetical protein